MFIILRVRRKLETGEDMFYIESNKAPLHIAKSNELNNMCGEVNVCGKIYKFVLQQIEFKYGVDDPPTIKLTGIISNYPDVLKRQIKGEVR